MASEFIIFLEASRPEMIESPAAEETATVEAHFQYLKSLTARGVVVLAGRTTEPPHAGIVVLRAADRATAEQVARDDPGIQSGLFTARLQPDRVALRPCAV